MSHQQQRGGRKPTDEEKQNPDVTYETSILTDTYAFNKVNKVKKEPGPATYAPSTSYSLRNAPRATIGKEERFSSTFAGMFIRAEAASELQCRDSPGPVYSPGFSHYPRSQTVSWGTKPGRSESSNRFRDPHLTGLSAGPAAYADKKDKVLARAPRCRFGKSDRFMSFGGAYALNNSPWTSDGPTGELPNFQAVRPKSAAFSFGGGKQRPPKGDDPSIRSRPRTAFLTHSIRGGLARPATLECGIGPADYDTNQTAIDQNLKSQGKNKMGSASRFMRPGLVFLSSEHAKADGTVCSPGPKYAYNQNSLTFKPRQALTSLHWCP